MAKQYSVVNICSSTSLLLVLLRTKVYDHPLKSLLQGFFLQLPSMSQDSVSVKQEPEWQNCADEWGVSQAAAEVGLYADHQVKDEVVVGPELLQPRDETFAFCVINNTLKSSFKQDSPPLIRTDVKNIKDNTESNSEQKSTDTHTNKPVLKDCFVRLESIGHKARISHLTFDVSHLSLLSESSQSGNVQFKLRSCEVRLKRIHVEATSCWLPARDHSAAADIAMHHPSKERLNATGLAVSRQKNIEKRVKAGTASRQNTQDLQDMNIYTCNSCGRTFKNKNYLIRHLQSHLREKLTNKLKPFACETCGMRFALKVSLNNHKWKHTGTKPYACETCDVQFSRLDSLRYHERNHGGVKRFSCETCNKQFAHLSNLKRHKRSHTGEKPFLCEVCNKQFRLSTALMSHIATHARKELYSCEICQLKFVHFTSYCRHKQTHTGVKRFSCDFCEKQFARLSTMKIHERIHTGEKPYCCHICNKRCTQSSQLTAHSRTHTGEKPYSCDICKKQFAQSSGLKIHKRCHTNEKPYVCETCEKVFARKGSLVVHRRSHTGEKPYQCDVCKNRFTQSSALVNHKKLHTGEKPFSCKICNKRFVQKGHLKSHKQIHTRES